MPEAPAPLTDEEILAVLERERSAAREFMTGQLGTERRLAYEYYYGKLFGNEEDGSSQVVSQLVAEVIDAALPDIIRVFAASDAAVQCEPRNAEDVEAAEQATDLCNYVFWTQNNGFLLLYEMIKDALLQKVGVLKYYWDESVKVEQESYRGLTLDQVTMLSQDPEVEIIAATPYPDPSAQMGMPISPGPMQTPQQQQQASPVGGMGPMPSQQPMMEPPSPAMLFDVTVRRKKKKGRVKIDCIPPEEVYVSRRARSIDPQSIPYMGIRTRKTLSDLVEMGYDPEIVADLHSDDQLDDAGEARVARANRTGATTAINDDDASNPMMREVWYNEEYALIDVDGDGIAERRAICSVGDVLLHNEMIERVPLAIITPKIMPHEFFGVSLADDCMDLQLLKSTLWRQMLDNLYLTNHPMQEVVAANLIDIDDVLNPRPGGAVRVTSPGSITPLTVPFVAGSSFQMIEFLEKETEGRTGINRYGNAPTLNPDSLNKTLGGAEIAVERSQARVQLICRTFAETGIKDLFSGILWLLSKNQDKAMTIRIRNKWVNIDPRAWSTEYDFVCNVGLGTGSKDQQMQHMMMLGTVLQNLAQQGCVTPKNGYNFGTEYVKLLGFKDTGKYLTDPNAPPDPQNPKPPPPKDPKVQIAEMQMQGDQQKLQAATQIDEQKFQATQAADGQKFQAEQQAKERDAERQAALKHEEQQNALILQQSNDQRQSQLDAQAHDRELQKISMADALERDRMLLDATLRREEMQMKFDAQVKVAQMKPQPRPNA